MAERPISSDPQLDDEVTVEAEIIDLESGNVVNPELDRLLDGEDLDQELSDLQNQIVAAASVKPGETSGFPDASEYSSLEALMVAADMSQAVVKHGQNPLGPFKTVESLSALRTLLFDNYRNNKLVPLETRARALEIGRQIEEIEVTHEHKVAIAERRAATEKIQAETESMVAGIKSQADIEIAKVDTVASIADRQTAEQVAEVERLRRRKSAEIDTRLMYLEKGVERFAKFFRLNKEGRRQLRQGLIAPILWVFVPLIVVANLVADDPARADTPVLGTVNNIWDTAYEPIRDGVIRVYDQFATEGQAG